MFHVCVFHAWYLLRKSQDTSLPLKKKNNSQLLCFKTRCHDLNTCCNYKSKLNGYADYFKDLVLCGCILRVLSLKIMAAWVVLFFCIQEVMGLNPGLEIDYITNSCDFPQSTQANARLVPQVRSHVLRK